MEIAPARDDKAVAAARKALERMVQDLADSRRRELAYGRALADGRAAEAAELHDVRVHDLRHTFAVHWVTAGLPLARLQKLLGHRTPAMTMRYARHAPEAYFAEDAARLSASLSGGIDREAEAVRQAVIRRADSA